MDLSVGKVRQAAGVVEVEVRCDDVTHVARLEAESANLRDRGLARIDARANDREERTAELARVACIREA